MALDSTVKVKFLGDAANLAREAARASKATDQVGKSAEAAHSHLSRMAKSFIAGASIGAAAVGIEKFAKSSVNAFKDAAGEASKLSRLTGLAAEDASRLGFAAHETGVDMDGFTKALGILSKNLNGADKAQTVLTKTHHLAIEQVPKLVKGHIEYVAQLKNVTDVQKHTVAGTQSLGFALRDATGHLLPMSELLPKIADKFKDMANGPEKTALALKLFGRGGAALLPFLNKGAEGLKAFGEEADKLGITMSTKDVEGYRAYIASQRQFKAAIEGVKISLGRELFPLFASWSKSLADNAPMVAGYARELGQKIGPAAQRAATAIKDLAEGFRDSTGTGGQIRDILTEIGTAVRFLVDHAGGVKKAAEAMALYALASKSAAIWSTRLAGANALGKVSRLLGGVALAGPAAAGSVDGVGASIGSLAGPIALTIGPLAALYGTLMRISALAKGIGGDIGPLLHLSTVGLGDKPDPGKGKTTQQLIDGMTPKQRTQFYKDYPQLDPTIHPTTPYHRHAPQVPDDYDAKTGGTLAQKTAAASSRSSKAVADAAKRTADAQKAATDKAAADTKAALDQQLGIAAAAQKAADAKAAAADALQQATDKLRDALQSRVDTAKGIRDSLISSNSIVRDGVSWTAKDLLSRFTLTMDKVKRFQSALSSLVAKGFDPTIVSQVAAAGVQGGLGTAVGLAHASAGQVRQINATQRAISGAAGSAGNRVAGQMGPIQITTNLVVSDKVLATAVNRWNARNGYNGSRLAS